VSETINELLNIIMCLSIEEYFACRRKVESADEMKWVSMRILTFPPAWLFFVARDALSTLSPLSTVKR
jgi:hypothetical protein